MHIFTIYFKCSLVFDYSEMLRLFNQLIVPVPSNVQTICTTNQTVTLPNGNTYPLYYSNWGYAQINALVLTAGQKYSVQLQNPGYVVLNLVTYSTSLSQNAVGSTNYNYNTFNLNDYDNYIDNSNVNSYTFNTVGATNLAVAYGYVDSNGFTLDLTNLPSNYAMILGLVKFDYIQQFTTYTQKLPNGTTNTYNVYGMSTALNNTFNFAGINSAQINTTTFLGIPVNTNIQFNTHNAVGIIVGYQLNDNFLVNDETVSNNAFTFPTDQSNVTAIPQNTSALIQPNALPGTTTLIQFGSPQNVTYYSIVNFSNNQTALVEANGSNTSPGLPNTNTIVDSDITLPQPYIGGFALNFKSLYNNNGYNDIWVLSNNVIGCGSQIYPPYFTSYNPGIGNNLIQLSSSDPDIIYQYIVQAPIVQVSTTTQSIITSSSSTTTSTTTTTPSSTTVTQQQTKTSSTTVTNITQQIVTALANPIVALILALALVGLAVFVIV